MSACYLPCEVLEIRIREQDRACPQSVPSLPWDDATTERGTCAVVPDLVQGSLGRVFEETASTSKKTPGETGVSQVGECREEGWHGLQEPGQRGLANH